MNRYPLWKYIVIGVALLLGLIYTLPNFFGESPAVQVSPVRAAVKPDQTLLKRVESILAEAKISIEGIFLDATGVKVRFPSTDIQLKAKDVLQAKLSEEYVVALNLLSNAPGFFRAVGALPMYLGLDLRGGVHFLLQVDMKAALAKAAERYANDIRSTLRDKKIQYSGISREGQTVQVRFRDAQSRERAVALIER